MPVLKAWLSLPAQGQCVTFGSQFVPLQLGVLSEERGCWFPTHAGFTRILGDCGGWLSLLQGPSLE